MYETIIRPILFKINPEIIHNVILEGLHVCSAVPGFSGAMRRFSTYRSKSLRATMFGMEFEHPIGLAAGLDKYGSACRAWEAFDFSFAEIGSVSYEPQPGNAKPRLWRIPEKKALQVNFGLNSKGAQIAQNYVQKYTKKDRLTKIGISIAKTTRVPEKEAVQDYLRTFDVVHADADYITINVSCPNVCNFTEMQHGTFVRELLKAVSDRNSTLDDPKRILVKIGPDLKDKELFEMCDLVQEFKIDGIIATNLLKQYGADLPVPGKGGLSGSFVKEKSTQTIRKIFAHTHGDVPIIGLGGISTGADALEKIKAGASLLQIYTSFIYRGPLAVKLISKELDALLKQEGFKHYTEAIGVDAQK